MIPSKVMLNECKRSGRNISITVDYDMLCKHTLKQPQNNLYKEICLKPKINL